MKYSIKKYLGVCLLIVLAVTGCTSLQPAHITTFSTGVTTAKNQTSLAFQGITDLTNDAIIDYAVKQKTLKEEYFFSVLDPAAVATYDRVFASLEKYCQCLIAMTSPDLTKDFKDASVQLANDIKTTGEKLEEEKLISKTPQINPTLATAFTKIAEVLLRAVAQSEARRIMVQTDPYIRQIYGTLADSVIGTSHSQPGALRNTVFENWNNRKSETAVAFLVTKGPPENLVEGRRLALQYASQIEAQYAQDMVLSSLRRSYLALADAHHSIAQGQDVSAAAAVSIVIDEIKDTKALYERFKALTSDDKK